MSICSTHSAKSAPLSTVFSNGYKFITTKSIPSIQFSSIACWWLSLSRTASIPPWIFGCKVFTLPPIISGKSVTSLTLVTLMPFSASNLAVPPVEISSIPISLSALANSTIPDLSDTESNARFIIFILLFAFTTRLLTATTYKAPRPRASRCLIVNQILFRIIIHIGKLIAHLAQLT